ncbi:tyrosine-type recombinase/integrase [uncultured Jannaschia sp.]|uniref:tyrosine-type recombinase/integrase n=1 Tax=uncultured Jannaschia sp. TaxID=293347 RepID=UPI002623C765|nr:tyrosine-type recombinase/integrase [uncultured Jannaschia sp.]
MRKEAARIIADADAPSPDPECPIRALHDGLQSPRDEIRQRSFTQVEARGEGAADTLGVPVAGPTPLALARSATSALVKLREAELEVHELGEDPRIAVAETLRRHGVATKPNGEVAPLIRLSDGVRAACEHATPEMRKKTETTGRLVAEFLGDVPLDDLEGQLPDLMRTLSRLPKAHGKAHGKNRFTSDGGAIKSKLDEIREADERDQHVFDELAADPDLSEADRRARVNDLLVPRVTVTNLKRHLDGIHRILRAAERELGYTGKTKIMGYRTLDRLVARDTEERQKENPVLLRATQPKERDRWDDAHLKTLLTSPLYRGSLRGRRAMPGKFLARDALYWVPLVLLTMGTRVTEVLQLRRRDLVLKNGVHCLRLCWDADQRGKTQDATRIVPISQMLIDLGFLDWIMRLGRSDAYLFPEIVNAKPSDPGSIFGGRIRTVLIGLGIDDTSQDFYALRKTFSSALWAAGVSEDNVQKIIGHVSHTTVGEHYIYRDMARLKQLLDSADFGLRIMQSRVRKHSVIADCTLMPETIARVEVILDGQGNLGACRIRRAKDDAQLLALRIGTADRSSLRDWSDVDVMDDRTAAARLWHLSQNHHIMVTGSPEMRSELMWWMPPPLEPAGVEYVRTVL